MLPLLLMLLFPILGFGLQHSCPDSLYTVTKTCIYDSNHPGASLVCNVPDKTFGVHANTGAPSVPPSHSKYHTGKGGIGVGTSTYTTTFTQLGSEGWTAATYTVTDTFRQYTDSLALAPSNHGYDRIPDGFKATVVTCHNCDTTPVVKTLTVPYATTTLGYEASRPLPYVTSSKLSPSYHPSAPYALSNFTMNSTTNANTSTNACDGSSDALPLTLVGVSEDIFNPANTPFSVHFDCDPLAINNYTAYTNWEPILDTSSTATSISFTGMPEGYSQLSLLAMSASGLPIFQSYELLFGSADLPVRVLQPNGQPALGVSVEAVATNHPGVGQILVTDTLGMVTFKNVPAVTIGLLAKAANNQISVDGIAGGKGLAVTLQLLPFDEPTAANSGFEIANGTTDWIGGITQESALKLRRSDHHLWKRDSSLVLSTNAQPNVQGAHKSFFTKPTTSSVYIEYMFQTAEIPGGFFGSKFNDYFSVTIRSSSGGSATVTHSMNELGRSAFDDSGATKWYSMSLDVPADTKAVEFNIATSNVADNLFDSKIMVRKVGENAEGKCADCQKRPNGAMCQDVCKSPPPNSCGFYRSCSEATLACGSTGYALRYGERTCSKYINTLAKFSPNGQTWVTATEQCMQKALIPFLDCQSICELLELGASSSLASCYISNGYCSLDAMDYSKIVPILKETAVINTLKSAVVAEPGCATSIIAKIDATVSSKLASAASSSNVQTNLADAKALAIVRAFHHDLSGDDGPVPSSQAAVDYIQLVFNAASAYRTATGATKKSANILVMEWLRHRRYNDKLWLALTGSDIDATWVKFATDHGVPFHTSYPDPDKPTESVGFDHLGATMNAHALELTSLGGAGVQKGDVGGWFGDLCQLYANWQLSKIISGKDFVLQTLGVQNVPSGFPLEDIRQDAEGYVMAHNMLDNPGRTIVEEFRRLLLNGGFSTRYQDFLIKRFGGSAVTASKVACDQLTNHDSFVLVAARVVIIHKEGTSRYPELIPRAELQTFCDGFGQRLADLAGLK